MANSLAPYIGARLSVTVVYPRPDSTNFTFRRFGFGFTQEPTELALSDLASSHDEAVEKLIALAGEARVQVTLILPDETEQVLGEPDIASLQAELDAARSTGPLCSRCAGPLD